MTGANIDLYTTQFWFVAVLALAVMIPLAEASARKWAFALVNLLFMSSYLNLNIVFVIGFLAITWCSLRLMEPRRPRVRRIVWGVMGSLVFSLFVMHKLGGLEIWLEQNSRLSTSEVELVKRSRSILTVIGFSYMALRWVEVSLAVWDGRRKAPDFAAIINYLAPFHMLAAGPIQAYDDFASQPAVPKPLGFVGSLVAIERITAGLFKKYVLATIIEGLFRSSFRAGGLYFFIELQFNYIWLFLDFSAYSDIAVGLGILMGIATPENFNKPLLARNLIDYWERWHISLSQFIRRNVFIPIQMTLLRLTGGVQPLAAAGIAFFVSFLLCGLWHEISWRWFAWGGVHAIGLVACNLYRAWLIKRFGRKGYNKYMANRWYRTIATIFTFEYVALSLVIITANLKELSWWKYGWH